MGWFKSKYDKLTREEVVDAICKLEKETQNKLKAAIDDNQFFKNTSKVSLGNLLSDQKGLAKFLNKTLNTRVAAEDVLTSADETFKAVEDAYEKNGTIYGMNDQDDALLAMFETEEMVADEQQMYSEKPKAQEDTE